MTAPASPVTVSPVAAGASGGAPDASAACNSTRDARERILEAARRVFATAGFEGASTRRIAVEAGVAQSLLLYHFGSKDALWRAMIDQLFTGLRARMTALAGPVRHGTARQRLEAMIDGFVALCAEDADIHRIMTIEGRSPSPRLRWLVEAHLKDNYREAVALILEGQRQGVVRPGDPTLLYYSFIAIAGTAFSLAPEIKLVSGDDDAVDPDAIRRLIRALVFNG